MAKITKKDKNEKLQMQNTTESSNEILDADKPLSQSLIWKLQAGFYANQGPEAWIKGIVPQYITTNPYIAHLYAKTVFAYCRDIAFDPSFDPDTTIYIMELAAGVGRFTYAFLKSFLPLIEKSSLQGLRFKYIITDLAERNVSYWLNHSFLKPYFEQGVLDCATFDMTKDEELHLRHSGELLRKNKLSNPLILIANYTFDSLPQDTFYVNEGELYEGLISISKANGPIDSTDHSILAGLTYDYTDRLIQGNSYYEENNINDILLYYQENLPDSAFSLPIDALRCLNRLMTLFGDDLLLISTDKGYRNIASMKQIYHPFLSKHGSISLTVNFHAMELYFKSLGGQAIHSLFEHENVTMSLFFLSNRTHAFVETSLAYHEIVESIGPDDFYTIKKAVVPMNPSLSTRELLTFLRYTRWDSRTFLEFYNTFLKRIAEEEDFPRDEMVVAIHKVWEYFLPIGEEGDLAYCLGTLLAYFGYDREAIALFQSSIEFYGEDAAIYYEIALCHYNLQESEPSLAYLTKALALEPDLDEATQLKELLATR